MNHHDTPRRDNILTRAEVAKLLRVDPKTVTRWAKAGQLSSIRTPGGHRRYSEAEVLAFADNWTGRANVTPLRREGTAS